MWSDMIVRNILALSDRVDERCLSFRVPDPHEGNARNRQSDTFFRLQHSILVPDLADDLVQIISRAVGLCWCHFEHEASILKHKGKV